MKDNLKDKLIWVLGLKYVASDIFTIFSPILQIGAELNKLIIIFITANRANRRTSRILLIQLHVVWN